MGRLTADPDLGKAVLRQVGISIVGLALILLLSVLLGTVISRSVGLIVAALGVLVVFPWTYHRLFVARGSPLQDIPISAIPPIPPLFGWWEQE